MFLSVSTRALESARSRRRSRDTAAWHFVENGSREQWLSRAVLRRSLERNQIRGAEIAGQKSPRATESCLIFVLEWPRAVRPGSDRLSPFSDHEGSSRIFSAVCKTSDVGDLRRTKREAWDTATFRVPADELKNSL